MCHARQKSKRIISKPSTMRGYLEAKDIGGFRSEADLNVSPRNRSLPGTVAGAGALDLQFVKLRKSPGLLPSATLYRRSGKSGPASRSRNHSTEILTPYGYFG